MTAPRIMRSVAVRIAAIALTALIAAALAVSVHATPSARAAGCGDGVVVLGARGSGEPASEAGGLGNEVRTGYDSFARSLLARGFQGRIRFQPVDYPASNVGTILVPGLGPKYYFGGLTIGVDNTITQLYQIQNGLRAGGSACAGPRIVLMGFSQGAMVMHRVLRQLAPGGSDANAELLSRIGGALLIADGEKRPGDTSNLYPRGVNPSGSYGVGQRFPSLSGTATTALPSSVRDRTFSACIPRDLVCDTPPSLSLNLIDAAVRVNIHTQGYKGLAAAVSGEYGAAPALANRVRTAIAATPPPTTTPPTTTPPTTTPPDPDRYCDYHVFGLTVCHRVIRGQPITGANEYTVNSEGTLGDADDDTTSGLPTVSGSASLAAIGLTGAATPDPKNYGPILLRGTTTAAPGDYPYEVTWSAQRYPGPHTATWYIHVVAK